MEFAFDLKEFFRSLLIYHYVFFGVASFLTIAMMILGVILRRHLWAALLCFGLSFFGFSIGVPVGGYFLESYLRPSSLQNVTVHRLEFSKAIVFTADIKNDGGLKSHKQYLVLKLVKKEENSILQYVHLLNPVISKKSHFLQEIAPSESKSVRIVLDVNKVKNLSDYVVFYEIKTF